MKLINFKNDVELLTKDEIGRALNLEAKDIHKNKKANLVGMFLEQHSDNLSIRKMYKNYSYRFALHPTKLQDILDITSTERKRWTSEGKLKVDHYDSFYKWGRDNGFPMYDAFEISKITAETIEVWRSEHKKNVRENRKNAIERSISTRKRNQVIQRKFYEKEWKEMLSKWFKVNGELGVTLQLSFWTVWLSRWAKEFQSKSFRARTRGVQFNNKKEQFYELKNDAMELLMRSPYTKLSFYSPHSPHKIFNLQFCSNHYSIWCDLREFEYVGKWDFFQMYEKAITSCPGCAFDQVADYYSLYYLSVNSVELEDFRFSFHIPYPIGKNIFPPQHDLEKVFHKEQEGVFRFGRSLFEEEKIIFTEKEVLNHFNEARDKFLLYFPK